MSWLSVVELLKSILPTKKIAAWIVALLTAVVALVMGVNSADIKSQFCSSDTVVTLPKLVPAPAASIPPLPDTAPTPDSTKGPAAIK